MPLCIVIWQRMLSPHMTELAREVARAGAEVHYVAEEQLSKERQAMGWRSDPPSDVTVHFISSPLDVRRVFARFPNEAIHITQGLRSNGLIGEAQRKIVAARCRHYPIMEKVDLRGLGGRIKPLVYALRLQHFVGKIEGILAIGEGTAEWVIKQSRSRVSSIPFAYFLKEKRAPSPRSNNGIFKFIFVGALITRKRVDLLIQALAGLIDSSFILEIVGDGPERAKLQAFAETQLPRRVSFLGTAEMDAAIERIAVADCLVLPSDQDGWGAVVSEAQINGTPVICSSACGAAASVRASGFGGVFESENVESLRGFLRVALNHGPMETHERERLSIWAESLTARSGAQYLLEILHRRGQVSGYMPPWSAPRSTVGART